MKSEFGDRETIGTQLVKKREEHLKQPIVEIGDLGHELGKGYMKGLQECIDNHVNSIDKYYIEVKIEEEPFFRKQAYKFIFIARRTCPAFQPNRDVYWVNNIKGKSGLLWSLPQRSRFFLFFRDKEKKGTSKKLIKWMEMYLDLEKKAGIKQGL